jgi:hypothetical protein
MGLHKHSMVTSDYFVFHQTENLRKECHYPVSLQMLDDGSTITCSIYPQDVQQCDYIYKHPQHVIFEMHYVLPCSRFTFLLNDTIIVRSN